MNKPRGAGRGRRLSLSLGACIVLVLTLSACSQDGKELSTLNPKGPYSRSIDRLFVPVHDEPSANRFGELLTKLEHFRELVPCVYMEEREWDWARIEGLSCQMHEHARVFPDRIQQHRVSELGDNLPDDVDGLRLESLKM